MTLRHEDGDDETQLPPSARKDRRRASVGGTNERRGLERRRSRRHSLQNSRGHASAPASPSSPHTHTNSFLPFGGQRVEDISERWGRGESNGKVEDNQKKKLYLCSNFSLNLVWSWFKRFSQEGLFWSRLYFKPWEIAPTEMESQIILEPVEHLSVSQETAWLQVLYCISVLERNVHSVSSQSREFNYIVI